MCHFVKGHFYLKNYFYLIFISDWAKASALIIYKLWLSKIDLASEMMGLNRTPPQVFC